MIQIDETKIGRLLDSLNNNGKEKVEASVSFKKNGLQLTVSTENIDAGLFQKIDSKEWTLSGIRPTYERRNTELIYSLPYDSLTVTNELKEAIKEVGKKDIHDRKRGIRGVGIALSKCPTCGKAGRLKIHDGYVAVYHKSPKKGGPAEVHAMTRYIKSLEYEPEIIVDKLEKVIRGDVKIENWVPSSGNMIVVEGSGKDRVTSEDLAYYLKQLRESN